MRAQATARAALDGAGVIGEYDSQRRAAAQEADMSRDYVADYDRDPFYIVVRKNDALLRHLGGMPTPALISACSDGSAQDAWRTAGGIWRLRDDAYDAAEKPSDMAYTSVMVGRPPQR
jgi:hypothetical protein